MKGQMLIEIVLSTMVIALVLVGALDLITRSSATAQYQKSKQTATRLVETKLAEFKAMQTDDGNNFMNNVVDPKSIYRSCDFGNADYKCEVMFEDMVDGGGVTVSVRAVWTDKTTDDRNVELSTSISFGNL